MSVFRAPSPRSGRQLTGAARRGGAGAVTPGTPCARPRGSALWWQWGARPGRLPGVHCAGSGGRSRGGGGGDSPKVTGAGSGRPRGAGGCWGGGCFAFRLRLGHSGPGADGAGRPRRLRGVPGAGEEETRGSSGPMLLLG